jgi:hypothetical protein
MNWGIENAGYFHLLNVAVAGWCVGVSIPNCGHLGCLIILFENLEILMLNFPKANERGVGETPMCIRRWNCHDGDICLLLVGKAERSCDWKSP